MSSDVMRFFVLCHVTSCNAMSCDALPCDSLSQMKRPAQCAKQLVHGHMHAHALACEGNGFDLQQCFRDITRRTQPH